MSLPVTDARHSRASQRRKPRLAACEDGARAVGRRCTRRVSSGALRGLHELLHGQTSLPFPILVGASAGSITNAFLGAHAADFPTAVRKLVDFWEGLRPDDVFRTDARTLARVGLSWAADLSLGSWIGTGRGRSLLVSDPASRLCSTSVSTWPGSESPSSAGCSRGFALTTTSYRSGLAVTFFDGSASIEPLGPIDAARHPPASHDRSRHGVVRDPVLLSRRVDRWDLLRGRVHPLELLR